MFPIVAAILLAAGAPAVTHVTAGENWPQFRGPTGDGHSDSVGLPLKWSESENVKWKTPIHGRGWSSPVIRDGQIWMATATEDGTQMFAVCVDAGSGRVVHDLKMRDVAEPAFCHPFNSYASCTPVIEPRRVYVHFGSYGTFAIDTEMGKTIWSRTDLPCDHFRGPGSSPILYGDLLIVHFDGFDFQYVVALDKNTGETVWKKDRAVDYGTDNGDFMKAYSTPIVIRQGDEDLLISPTSKAVLAYEVTTGEERWRVRYEGFSATARPVFDDGLLFINTGFSRAELLAIRAGGRGDVTDSHVEWRAERNIGSKPSPLLVDGLVYNSHDAGTGNCLDAKTGEVVWQARLGGNYTASPLYADGRIYFFNEEGATTVLKPGRTREVLAVNELDDGFMASPAVTGKALILRTKTHLYRIEK
jgi:outer membrane protein assembly factor BamB